MLFQLVLPLAAPLTDAVALYSLVTGTASVPAIAWGVFCIAQLALAAHALRRNGENLRHLWLIPLQRIPYRTALCLVTLHALVTAALGMVLCHAVGVDPFPDPALRPTPAQILEEFTNAQATPLVCREARRCICGRRRSAEPSPREAAKNSSGTRHWRASDGRSSPSDDRDDG
ncbi:hypothetical protein [Streptomyces sp. SP17KL33]|uniref:hypothetical protein n=1 Tax=Streptomyces sp. SP17KL33 TaxID=3002534 RepID=UPI002E766CE7|nr:hypothetical protein [Streptomyces sp. SP17KL33]MEE1829370.1 hypothetical protein [Streptomyces sp. SP17KL33]